MEKLTEAKRMYQKCQGLAAEHRRQVGIRIYLDELRTWIGREVWARKGGGTT